MGGGFYQPVSGGPVEVYIARLEQRLRDADEKVEAMREQHGFEVQDLEDEFEVSFG